MNSENIVELAEYLEDKLEDTNDLGEVVLFLQPYEVVYLINLLSQENNNNES